MGQAVFALLTKPHHWSNHWQKVNGITGDPPIAFTGLAIAPNANYPRTGPVGSGTCVTLHYSYNAGGHHDLRSGGVPARHQFSQLPQSAATCEPSRAIPRTQSLFPNPFDVDTCNWRRFSPLSRLRHRVGDFNVHLYSKKVASWAPGRLADHRQLTLNLGLRYDSSSALRE